MMWMKKYSMCCLALLALCTALYSQPGDAQSERILVIGATAHLGTGVAIERSAIGFSNGKIDYVGTPDRVNRNHYDRIIQADGKHVYPGFIASNTNLGLSEISAVRATNDYREVGEFNPNVRAIVAYDAESIIIPTTVTNGVLLAQITPSGGVFSGTSSVVQLDAWNWEDAVIRMDDGVHLNWPRMTNKSGWYGSFGELETSEKSTETIEELKQFFRDARSYCSSGSEAVNLRLKALCGVLSGSQNLYVHTNRVKDIASVIHFAKQNSIVNIVIVGGEDAWMIPEMFRENKVKLILSGVHRLPDLPGDDLELPCTLPLQMRDANVTFCLQNAGRFDRMNLRNFPFSTGSAVACGLPYEQAIQSITLDVATILGIDDNYGSLEVGKSATLFISEGDALDIRGSNLTHAFIDGRVVGLENGQEKLFKRYRQKYSE